MRTFAALLAVGLAGCVQYRPFPQYDPPLTRVEAERLAAAGVSEPVLIEIVEKRGALKLSADDLVAIKQAGASDGVVQKLITHERKEPERVHYAGYDYCPVYHHHSYYCYPWWGWGFSAYGSGSHFHSRRRVGWGVHFGW